MYWLKNIKRLWFGEMMNFRPFFYWVSKTKIKVITQANHKGRRQSSEPEKTLRTNTCIWGQAQCGIELL